MHPADDPQPNRDDLEDRWERLRVSLDAVHDFPCYYTMKLIFPSELFYHVKSMMPDIDFSSRGSKKGNYLSLTYHVPAGSSEEVVRLYRRIATIKGVIAL